MNKLILDLGCYFTKDQRSTLLSIAPKSLDFDIPVSLSSMCEGPNGEKVSYYYGEDQITEKMYHEMSEVKK